MYALPADVDQHFQQCLGEHITVFLSEALKGVVIGA